MPVTLANRQLTQYSEMILGLEYLPAVDELPELGHFSADLVLIHGQLGAEEKVLEVSVEDAMDERPASMRSKINAVVPGAVAVQHGGFSRWSLPEFLRIGLSRSLGRK